MQEFLSKNSNNNVFFNYQYWVNFHCRENSLEKKCVLLLLNCRLIKPNLDCDSFDNKVETLSTLQDKLELFIDGIKKNRQGKKFGGFVRDMGKLVALLV